MNAISGGCDHEEMRLPASLVPACTRRAALQLLSTVPFCLFGAAPSASHAANAPVNSGVRTRSGIEFIDYQLGKGPSPRFGQLLRFHYVLYTLGSQPGELVECDSTYERKPYFTKHGNGFSCQGLEEAIHTMNVGGRRRVVIPPALSYTSDKGPVPPEAKARRQLYKAVTDGQPVVFDVELVAAVDDLLDRGDYEDLDVEDAAEIISRATESRTATEATEATDPPSS